jgi:cation:H+ antiporter
MSLLAGIALFIVGLILVVFFAERLVEGAVGTALGFGVSVFLISVIFLGFDPENLAVGVAGSFKRSRDLSGLGLPPDRHATSVKRSSYTSA